MSGPQPLLEKLRVPAARGESQRLEAALAAARVFVILSSLVVHSLDTQPASRNETSGWILLITYLAQSIAILILLRGREVGPRFSRVVHGLDMFWALVLTATIQSASHPFFLFFVFVVFAAAYRWGLRAALWSAAASALLILVEKLLISARPQDFGNLWRADSTCRAS